MRGGLSGFLIFIACIALGVGAIGGVGSVARAIEAGVANQGQTLLGGDMRFELNQREASAPERAFLDDLGQVAVSAGMRSMARLEDGSDQALVEAKAVDGAYPLFGELATEPKLPPDQLFAERDGVFGAAAPDILFDRLGLSVGGRILLGTSDLRAARQNRSPSRTPSPTVLASRPGCCFRWMGCARPDSSSRAVWSSMSTR